MQDNAKRVSPGDCANEVNYRGDGSPEVAGHGLWVAAEDLKIKADEYVPATVFAMTLRARTPPQNPPKPRRPSYPATTKAPEEIWYALDQVGFVAMPEARPMPRRSTKEKDKVRPANVIRKIFHLLAVSG